MFRWINGLVKFVTLVSTLMLAFEQMRKIMRERELDRQGEEQRREAA